MRFLLRNRRPGVHQFLVGISVGDAISNEAFYLQNILKKSGFSSHIFAKGRDSRVKNVGSYENYQHRNEDILIYHYSTRDSYITDAIKKLPNKKVMIYHNVTPPEFFKGYSETIYKEQKKAREELILLNEMFDTTYADSAYSARELESFGFKKVRVLPIVYNFERLEKIKEDKRLATKLKSKYIKNIIFVGRIAPNKKQEDIIRAFFIYNKHINSLSRLFLIGNQKVTPRYTKELRDLVKCLDLEDVVCLPGHITDEQWITYYKYSDIFISMSEHEGFFVPALECMYYKIPMLLYKSSAVPETAGNAALYFESKDFGKISEMMNIVIENRSVRKYLNQQAGKRLLYFRENSFVKNFVKQIKLLTL